MILVYFGKDIILNQVFGHITAEVKGHADNHYNNRCDELARDAIKNL